MESGYPGKFAATPVIRLTASAVTGDREKLLAAGFTGYLAKPVNIEEMEDTLRKNLSEQGDIEKDAEQRTDAVASAHESGEAEDDELSMLPKQLFSIEGIDVVQGINYCGDADDYLHALKTFHGSMEEKASQLENYLEKEDMENFTLIAHSLKSTSKAVGAGSLSDMAKALEAAGNDRDMETVKRDTPLFIKAFKELENKLSSAIGV